MEKLIDKLIQVSKETETFEEFRTNRFYKGLTKDSQNVI